MPQSPYYPPDSDYPQQSQYHPYPPAAQWGAPDPHWRPPKGQKSLNLLTAAAGGLIAICLLGLLFGALMRKAGPSQTGQQTGSSAPEATATSVPPTATPANIVSGPRLGGIEGDFRAAFGDPIEQAVATAPPHFADPNAPGGFNLVVCFCATYKGTDNQSRAWSVQFWTADGTTLTVDQLHSAAQDFFPPDAKYQSDFTDPQLGIIHVFTSNLLAKTFPADDFTSSGPPGPDATPGMFSVSCGEPEPTHGCTMVIGN